MKALFDSFIEDGTFGYFIDNHTNNMFQYDLTDLKIVRNWSLVDNNSMWHMFESIDIIDDRIVAFPMGNTDFIIHDKEHVIKRFRDPSVDNSDLHPIYSKNRTLNKSYAFMTNSFGFYKINFYDEKLEKIIIPDNIFGNSIITAGVKNMYIEGDEAFFLLKDKKESILCFSCNRENVYMINPQVGNIVSFMNNNGGIWIVNEKNEVLFWTKEKGVVFRESLMDIGDVYDYLGKNCCLYSVDNKIVLLGMYKDGSVLCIDKVNYTVENCLLESLLCNNSNEIKKSNDNIWASLNCGSRQFLQWRSGDFCIGDSSSIKRYHAIDIPFGLMAKNAMIMETESCTLKDLIKEIR